MIYLYVYVTMAVLIWVVTPLFFDEKLDEFNDFAGLALVSLGWPLFALVGIPWLTNRAGLALRAWRKRRVPKKSNQ